jgi:hypothetical protein
VVLGRGDCPRFGDGAVELQEQCCLDSRVTTFNDKMIFFCTLHLNLNRYCAKGKRSIMSVSTRGSEAIRMTLRSELWSASMMQLLLVNTSVVIVVTSHLFLTPAVVVAPLLVYVGTQRLLVNASAVVVVTNRLFLCGQMLLVNAMLCLETRALGEGDDRLITRLWNKLSAPCSCPWGLFLGNWRVGGIVASHHRIRGF